MIINKRRFSRVILKKKRLPEMIMDKKRFSQTKNKCTQRKITNKKRF